MKTLLSVFKFQRFFHIAIMVFMLSGIHFLWGFQTLVDEGPFNFEYKYIPLSLTSHVGYKFAFTYTISLDMEQVTKYDKQRTYTVSSEFFSESKKTYGSFRTISSDIKDGQTFTYSQFPITGHLKLKYFGGIDAPFFDVDVSGYVVEGEQISAMPAVNKRIQQNSSFTMILPDEVGILGIILDIIKSFFQKVGYYNIARIIIFLIGILLLFIVIRLIMRFRGNKATVR